MVQSRYSFPNVSINSSVPGPIPQESGQRRRIGVAGVFSRGPELQLINSREEFAYLFGENNTAGSVFVRQAMLQGAEQFAVSRVMPSLRPSKGSITLSNGQNPYIAANVALQGNRTIGLKFTISYISSIVTPFGQYNNSSVTVSADSDIELSGYKGLGTFNFEVIEKVSPSNSADGSPDISLSIKNLTIEDSLLDAETFGTNQATQIDPITSEVFIGDADFSDELDLKQVSIVVATGDNIALLKEYAKPGLTLKANDTPGNGNAYLKTGLKFASYAYEMSDGSWGALLDGDAGVVSTSFTAKVYPLQSTATPYFIVAYNYTSAAFSQLPKYIFGVKRYTFGNANSIRTVSALGFLVVENLPISSKNLEFIGRYDDEDEDTVTYPLVYVNTGIKLNFVSLNSNNVEFLSGDRFSISVVKNTISVGETDPNQSSSEKAFRPGTPAIDILQNLGDTIARDVAGSTLLGDVSVEDSALPYTLNFTSNFRGAEANKVKYKLERIVSGGSNSNPLDLLFGGTGDNTKYNKVFSMSGGQSTMSPARRVLYDINGNPLVLIEAVSPGVEGNRIRISASSIRPGQFQLTVDDEEGSKFNISIRSETFSLSNYTVDPQTGLFPETIDSNIVRVYFIPTIRNRDAVLPSRVFDLTPQRVAPISQFEVDIDNVLSPTHTGARFLKDLYLEGGTTPSSYNPTNPLPDDYIDAINRLDSIDCVAICAPGAVVADSRYDSVINSLVLQAENSNTFNGIRTAVLSAPKGMSPSRSASISAPFNSNRVIIVSGWSSIIGSAGLGFNNSPPDGLYAGMLANLPAHISPAASDRSTSINGVFSVDTNSNPFVLDQITKANIEVLFFDAGLGVFKFLNGLNTDKSTSMGIVAISRMNDKIIQDLNTNLAWAKSRPNDRYLQRNVRDAVDAYFRTLLREQEIFSFSPTICDGSNNSPEDRARRRLNISISYTPLYPADYINVSLSQVINEQISIITG